MESSHETTASHPLRAVAAGLPRSPGVYLFKDRSSKVLYVGKAARLRDRVRSYFAPAHPKSFWQEMVDRLLRRARGLEHVVTSNAREALVLEASLIQLHRPPFNVRFRDDKRYPYLKLTSHQFPRVELARRVRDDGALYFGPFTDMKIRETMRLVRALFGLRDCKTLPDRACLNYHLGMCSAPCVDAIDEAGYKADVQAAADFLRGRNRPAKAALKQMMREAAARKEYERAADIRDHLARLETLALGQAARLQATPEADVVALDCTTGMVLLLHVRESKLLGRSHYRLESTAQREPAEVLSQFMAQYYSRSEVVPFILVEQEPVDKATLQGWLSGQRGSRVSLLVPQRGEKRKLVQRARTNLAELVRGGGAAAAAEAAGSAPAPLPCAETTDLNMVLKGLQAKLGLGRYPAYIEGFDVSTLQGSFTVGARVAFVMGLPDKSLYRRYRMKTLKGQDDYAALKEMLGRRLARGGPLPDWLLIDGGPGQLSAAAEALATAATHPAEAPSAPGFQPGRQVELLSLAKREELLYLHGRAEPIALDRTDPGLRLLQRVRDEAHRFGLAYHRRLRSKALQGSQLEDLEGVGPKRAAALLREFGSLEGVKRASVERIAALPGWGERSARRVKRGLRAF